MVAVQVSSMEDEALGFEVDLAIEPVLTLPQDVGAV